MKINTNHLVGAVIALAVVFLTSVDAQNQNPPVKSKRQKWEYALTYNSPEKVRGWNELGELGWELVLITKDDENLWKRPKQ
ncbi:hypothetical protein N8566_02580 [Verrucomicrobia bacterium]|nr:hypothetical protein [Verrucomicrobiota bacterium]